MTNSCHTAPFSQISTFHSVKFSISNQSVFSFACAEVYYALFCQVEKSRKTDIIREKTRSVAQWLRAISIL